MMAGDAMVELVEVGPRDGFQAIGPIISPERKIDFIRRLHAAGLRRMEATAFVSEKALAQMADAPTILAAAQALSDLDVQVLVPNQRYCERALAAGAHHVAFVLSVSERHNVNNVRRSPMESVIEYQAIAQCLPETVKMRLNVATAFDCPFEGPVEIDRTLAILAALVDVMPEAEIALCDTTGRVTPDRVSQLFEAAARKYPQMRWAFHGHDTYGLGVANVLAAYRSGVRVFDASFAGLGGCPFAPGATGNVATEDVVWTLEKMGIATGVDLASLLDTAVDGTTLAGALFGGRVRDAIRGAACAGVVA